MKLEITEDLAQWLLEERVNMEIGLRFILPDASPALINNNLRCAKKMNPEDARNHVGLIMLQLHEMIQAAVDTGSTCDDQASCVRADAAFAHHCFNVSLQKAFETYELRKCRKCGCTWDRACIGGCSWVEKDLCSACAE